MKKYRTETISYDALRPGDLIAVSYGFLEFRSLEHCQQDFRRLRLRTATGSIHYETHHASNWPERAIGLSDEYKAAHPEEQFP